MNGTTSSTKSLRELADAMRAELAEPHPADVQNAHLRRKLARTEAALRRAKRGAKKSGAARLKATKRARSKSGRAYASNRRASERARLRKRLAEITIQLTRARRGAKRRGAARLAATKRERATNGRAYRRKRQASAGIAKLIRERDRAQHNAERWRWIARTLKRDPQFGVLALGISVEAARKRADRAEAEADELRRLLRTSRERLCRAGERIEDLRDFRQRYWDASSQIRELQSELASAAAWLQSVEIWTIDVERYLGALLTKYDVPPPPQRPRANG